MYISSYGDVEASICDIAASINTCKLCGFCLLINYKVGYRSCVSRMEVGWFKLRMESYPYRLANV